MADNVAHQNAWLVLQRPERTYWLNPIDISLGTVKDNGNGTYTVAVVLTGGGQYDLEIEDLAAFRDTVEAAILWRINGPP